MKTIEELTTKLTEIEGEIKDWYRINFNKDSRKYYGSVNEINTLVAKKHKIEIRINQFRLRYWYWKK